MSEPRYRFGPLERRGVLAGLRPSQLGILAIGAASLLVIARAAPSTRSVPLMILTTLIVAVVLFVPVGGRPLDEWFPVGVRWSITALTRRRFFSSAPQRGFTSAFDPQPQFPSTLSGITILSHPVPGSEVRLGVIKDQRAATFTAVLGVRGRSFALLDAPDKARRLASWAGVMAGLAREGGIVQRLQWVERTVPDPGDEVGAYLKENIAVPLDSLIARSYLEVVDEAGPVTQQHEAFISLQIHAPRCGRLIKAAGGGDHGACEVLRRELASLAARLINTEIGVEGALTPRLIAAAMRTAFEPSSRTLLARAASRDPDREGTSIVNAGPLASECSWSTFRTDSTWHRTYWIAEWPRIDAEADFLAPLLLRTERLRTVSLTMQPISPLKAMRSVESARTSAAADEELRRRAGFVTTTRRLREQEALASHERDLSDGHAFYRFAGFVTVSASSRDELETACGEIEEAGGRSFLDLRRLNGEQDVALTYTLPLCRGLR